MNWVIGKKQKRRNRIKAQFGKNPMELEAWESLEKRMREIRMYEELVVQDVKKEEWQSAGSVDTVTWNDLEMDRVFARINHPGRIWESRFCTIACTICRHGSPVRIWKRGFRFFRAGNPYAQR